MFNKNQNKVINKKCYWWHKKIVGMYGIFVRYVQPCHTARVSTVLYISYEKLLVTVLELYTKSI